MMLKIGSRKLEWNANSENLCKIITILQPLPQHHSALKIIKYKYSRRVKLNQFQKYFKMHKNNFASMGSKN